VLALAAEEAPSGKSGRNVIPKGRGRQKQHCITPS